MALFKIFNNIDSKTPVPGEEDKFTYNGLPTTYNKGYMYFDASKSLFYIDTEGTGGNVGRRVALNAYGAYQSHKARCDSDENEISTTYLKIADINNYITESSNITIKTWVADPVS